VDEKLKRDEEAGKLMKKLERKIWSRLGWKKDEVVCLGKIAT
jgi:hypothetical protein